MGERSKLTFAFALVALVTGVARTALGHSNGITGNSGKTSATCNNCHQGGPAPKVTLSGPTQLEAGVPATYTFFVESTQKICGMNAAATDDIVLAGDDGGTTRLEGAEVTHAKTLKLVDGGALFTFTLTAPYGETISLWAAGNAANDNGQQDGDRASTTKLDITVEGPPRPPPPPPPEPPAPRPSATTAPPAADASADAGAAEAESTSDGSCALGPAPGDLAGPSAAGALVALVAMLRLARRRR